MNTLRVEQNSDEVYIGSTHVCMFKDYKAVLSPDRVTISDEGIMFAESCMIEEMNLSLIYEFVFKKKDEKNTLFAYRFINNNDSPIAEDLKYKLSEQLKAMAESLKEYSERMDTSFFEPAFRK